MSDIEELKCRCGNRLEFVEQDLDDTGHYEVWGCPECDTVYHLYEKDNDLWELQDNGLYERVNLNEHLTQE